MELSRQEYPALLGSLPPTQAVSVVNDRVRLIGKINTDIADWLAERRRIEEAYVQGLTRLASRRQEGASSLGVFQTPWRSVVASTVGLAESHSTFAAKVEADVEKPLRAFGNKNREMQNMSTVQGNLAAMAKEMDAAQKRHEKSASKGKTENGSGLQDAHSQWDSQAPFVFEQLQALDESRVNHLRDALTQLQTHELDQLERSRLVAESALNALLNVDTAEEISAFVAKTAEGIPKAPAREPSRPTTSGTLSGAQRPITPVPPRPHVPHANSSTLTSPTSRPSQPLGEGQSDVSGLSEENSRPPEPKTKSRLGGLRRLGTVISRRGKDKPVDRGASPEKRPKINRFPLRRSSSANMQPLPSPTPSMTELPTTPAPRATDDPVNQPPGDSQPTVEEQGQPAANGVKTTVTPPEQLPFTNGTLPREDSIAERASRPPSTIAEESAHSSAINDIDRAQQEAAAETEQHQFKLDIRNEPIREEDGDAQVAMSNVANALRASHMPPPQRRAGTMRGRRDVRNTIFVPSAQPMTDDAPFAGFASSAGSPALGGTTLLGPGQEHKGADAQSIRSSHSLHSLSHGGIKHPDMHAAGLNASIVETSSAWFSNGIVTKAVVIGELALSHNAGDTHPAPETIRLNNFAVLEKVATNPNFITDVPSRSGEYTLDLTELAPKTVAFKYQVHLDDTDLAAHAPILITPNWKMEPTQASAIVTYALNPAFAAPAASVSLSNVTLILHVEGARATSCQSKPPGVFSREKNTIYWKLGDVTLDRTAAAAHKLLARFAVEGDARPGAVEARWEMAGDGASAFGSGLGLSISAAAAAAAGKEAGSDPFADEGGAGMPVPGPEVPVTRRLVSGRYVAS